MKHQFVETWAPVYEFENYLVSDLGNIKRVGHDGHRLVRPNDRGYPVILLTPTGETRRHLRQVNRLVALAHLPPPQEADQTHIWHVDGDLINCAANNLMWERRDRVQEWNRMHRDGAPRLRTPRVKNNHTGKVYANAYECGMAEGILESRVVWRIEQQSENMFADYTRYRYLAKDE